MSLAPHNDGSFLGRIRPTAGTDLQHPRQMWAGSVLKSTGGWLAPWDSIRENKWGGEVVTNAIKVRKRKEVLNCEAITPAADITF